MAYLEGIPDELLQYVLAAHPGPHSDPYAPVRPRVPTQGAGAATPMGIAKIPVGPIPAGEEDTSALEAAMAADREAQKKNAVGQNWSRAAALYRGENVGAPVPTEIPDAMKEFILKRQLAAEGAAAKAAAAPAPPEWGAPATATRPEAIAGGWLKKPTEHPMDPLLEEKRAKLTAVDPLLDLKRRKLEADITKAGRESKPQGRPTVKVDDEGYLISVDPNTGDVTQVRDQAGNRVRGSDRGFEQDTQKLGEDLQFLGRMPQDLALLKSYRGKGAPGVGPISGRLPDWATSEEGLKVRKATMRLFNAMIYMSSGKQINESEARRMADAWMEKHSSDRSFDQGVEDFANQMKMAARTYYAKYRPRVLEQYGERGGFSGMGEFAPGAAKSTAETKPSASDPLGIR